MDLLRALNVFVHVNDEGSFAGAARRLDLAPAVVTRLVAELEEHLGVRLLNRTTRSLALTDVGAEYLARARKILEDVEDASALASSASLNPRGHLNVLVGAAVAAHQLAKHLPKFHEKYPDVTLTLHTEGVVETVDENFDLTIITTRNKLDGDFIARQLAQVEVVMCASPDYLARRGAPTHPSELMGHDALLPPRPSLSKIMLRRTSTNEDLPGDEVYEVVRHGRPLLSTSHAEINLAAARAGMGITGAPAFLVKEDLEAGRLLRVLPEWRLPCLTIWAAMPTREHLPARTRAFLDFLIETFTTRAGIMEGASCTASVSPVTPVTKAVAAAAAAVAAARLSAA